MKVHKPKFGVYCWKQNEELFSKNIVQYMGCSRLGSPRSRSQNEDLSVSSLIERWAQEALGGSKDVKREEKTTNIECVSEQVIN